MGNSPQDGDLISLGILPPQGLTPPVASPPAWAGTPNNIVDQSDSSAFNNIQVMGQLDGSDSSPSRARGNGRHVLSSEMTSPSHGIYQVKARLIKNSTPNGNVVCVIRNKSTHAVIAKSEQIANSSLSASIAVVTFTFVVPNTITVDVDIIIEMDGNSNAIHTTRDLGMGYTGETGRLTLHDDTDGDETTGWSYQTVNNARMTIIEDEVV